MEGDSPPSSSSGEMSEDFASMLEAELEACEAVAAADGAAVLDPEIRLEDPEERPDAVVETVDKDEAPAEVSLKRKRTSEEAGPSGRPAEGRASKDVSMGLECPPHPGYMWDICIKCGKPRGEDDLEVKAVALRYIHENMEVSQQEADRLRNAELRRVFSQRKLYLVLDLDHTLLNSARICDVAERDYNYLSATYHLEELSPTFISEGRGSRRERGGDAAPISNLAASCSRLEEPEVAGKTADTSAASPAVSNTSQSQASGSADQERREGQKRLEGGGTGAAEEVPAVTQREAQHSEALPMVTGGTTEEEGGVAGGEGAIEEEEEEAAGASIADDSRMAEEMMLLATETMTEEDWGDDDTMSRKMAMKEETGLGAKWRKKSLYRLPHLQMITKLRPGVFKFLEEVKELFELYVYTMGERVYANAMVSLLDPTGKLFGDRVISQGDSTRRHEKNLDVVLGAESAVIILDDTEAVWPSHRENLVTVERYHFFRGSRHQFGLRGLSLVEMERDECEQGGTLDAILQVLRAVHADAFAGAAGAATREEHSRPARRVGQEQEESGHLRTPSASLSSSSSSMPTTTTADVRVLLRRRRQRLLKGCRIIFSRVFPQDTQDFESHPLWHMATTLGATCNIAVDESTTHVVALDRTTEKAKWAVRNRRHLVRPDWIEAAHFLWKRPPEGDFAVAVVTAAAAAAGATTTTMQMDRQHHRGHGGVLLQPTQCATAAAATVSRPAVNLQESMSAWEAMSPSPALLDGGASSAAKPPLPPPPPVAPQLGQQGQGQQQRRSDRGSGTFARPANRPVSRFGLQHMKQAQQQGGGGEAVVAYAGGASSSTSSGGGGGEHKEMMSQEGAEEEGGRAIATTTTTTLGAKEEEEQGGRASNRVATGVDVDGDELGKAAEVMEKGKQQQGRLVEGNVHSPAAAAAAAAATATSGGLGGLEGEGANKDGEENAGGATIVGEEGKDGS